MPGIANDLNINEQGFQTFNNTTGVFNGRSLIPGTGISITNQDGQGGNPVISSTASNTDLHTATYIVNKNGTSGTGANYQTISSALSAASVAGVPATIFIMPGIYTENLTLVPSVNLTAFTCDGSSNVVGIKGTSTLSVAGTVVISNVQMQTNGAAALVVSGTGVSTIGLTNVNLACGFQGITFSNSNASSYIQLLDCTGDISSAVNLFSSTSPAIIEFINCTFTNSIQSTVASTISSGSVIIIGSHFTLPITTSGTAGIIITNSEIFMSTNTTALTVGGSGTNTAYKLSLQSGTASSLSISSTLTTSFLTVQSSNTNAITGAGLLTHSATSFIGSSSNVNTTSQTPTVLSNDSIKVITPGAYPYTTIPQDAIILVDTSSARTIIPLGSPVTGQIHIIKDSVGSASSNNITITPSGKNIDGAASSTINISYGSVTIVYNGTEWSIV